ncbi:Mitochondrial uncoupling protein 4 [Strongyloides ratti]|uniref:Mitochondrial uncoupling protein 4 n=1 Tax=Strongyloides ratti TaxID=34506 RepID=A0A090KZQ9_STRRB|nr:Mitochondrial uncoupling protein 4 [Strongyloides ratti]CEF60679.1 Mitochondrial uncoupling protein 4 [Strongyloides ratti]
MTNAGRIKNDDLKSSPYDNIKNVLLKYVLSCTAATAAETVTYPLDVTKTRLQISRDVKPAIQKPKGMIKMSMYIVKTEGMISLWRGVTPAIYRHYIYTGIRMGTYENIRNIWNDKYGDIRPFGTIQAMFCGLVSGAVAQFAASPMDLVKVQISTLQASKSLYKSQGFFGLWIGWIPNCQRAALLNMADLATYDTVKHWILRNTNLTDNWFTHGIASACSGLAAAIISLPSDVVKTRIMDQIRHVLDGKKDIPTYKGSIDCLMTIVRTEGFWALYRGFIPTYIRMAPWSLTFWICYEEIRKLTGAPSF